MSVDFQLKSGRCPVDVTSTGYRLVIDWSSTIK